MSDHNTAIRMAQNLLRQQADQFKDVEVGYHQHEPNPLARGYREAAKTIEALIMPEHINRPSHLDEQDRAQYPPDYTIQAGIISADRIVPTEDGMSLTTAAAGFAEQGSVTLEIPAALYEQAAQNEPGFSKWGVRISVNEDRSSRIEFPESTEQRYFQSGAMRVVQLTLREPNFPVDRMRTWSFNADFIVERTGDQQPVDKSLTLTGEEVRLLRQWAAYLRQDALGSLPPWLEAVLQRTER